MTESGNDKTDVGMEDVHHMIRVLSLAGSVRQPTSWQNWAAKEVAASWPIALYGL